MWFQPDKVAAVPIFGGWDENDPAAGENYTLAFNNVRHEKNSGSPMVSNMTAEQAYANKQKQNDRNKNKVYPTSSLKGKICFLYDSAFD